VTVSIIIPYEVPSLNKTAKMHWAAKSRINNQLVVLIRARSAGIVPPPDGSRRRVHIIAYRKRLMSDSSDNLPGGAKGLRDAIKRAGLLIDDSDKYADITYEQRLAKDSPNGKPETEIVFYPQVTVSTLFKEDGGEEAMSLSTWQPSVRVDVVANYDTNSEMIRLSELVRTEAQEVAKLKASLHAYASDAMTVRYERDAARAEADRLADALGDTINMVDAMRHLLDHQRLLRLEAARHALAVRKDAK
jgi:hypothetical protein